MRSNKGNRNNNRNRRSSSRVSRGGRQQGEYSPGSDYERDVELYRQIVGDQKHGGSEADPHHYAPSAGDAGRPRRKSEKRPPKRSTYDDRYVDQYAGDAGRPGGKGKKKKKYRLNKKGRRIKRTICVILAVLVAVSACAVFYFNSLLTNLDKVDTSNADFGINSGVSTDLLKYKDVVILGSDARKNEGYDGSRTDAIVIMRINRLTGEIRLISVMRDSYLKMHYTDGSEIYSKVTHAHAYGGGVNTCWALNQALDLNIKQFLIFNWKAVADTVDSLGGIEVTIHQNELSDLAKYGNETARNVGGTYHPITKTGKQTLDGVQAATYCRIRKTSGGDTGRARRYKATLTAIIKKAKSSDISTVQKTAEKALPEIRTNLSKAAIWGYMLQIGRYDITKNISWPHKYYGGIASDGVWYAIPRTLESNVKWLHKKAFDQDNYQPSSTSLTESNEIINRMGIQ